MLRTECFRCKGVNPFSSHLQDKPRTLPPLAVTKAKKSRFKNRLFLMKLRDLNDSTGIFVIRITRHFVRVVLDQVFTANTQPHGNGSSHEHG
jgi:hypothetical protein